MSVDMAVCGRVYLFCMERQIDSSSIAFQAPQLGDGILASGEIVREDIQSVAESAESDTWSPVNDPTLVFRRRSEEAGGGSATVVVDLITGFVGFGKFYGEYSFNGVPLYAAPARSLLHRRVRNS